MEEIIFVCKKCGKEAGKNEKDSNENWEVYNNKCKYCGGELKVVLRAGRPTWNR